MDDHHCSGHFRMPKRALIRVSVYLIALLGCALQSDYISQDYFRYPTTTYFSIVDSPPQITPPTLTLSFPYEAKIRTTLKDLFASLKNNVTLRSGQIKEVVGKRLDLKNRNKFDSFINTSISYRMGKYQLSLSLKANGNYTPSLYLDGFPMLVVRIVTNLIKDKDKKDDVLAFMTGRHGDTEGCPKTISLTHEIDAHTFLSLVTYSIKQIELLPSPYDTQCHNYATSGFTSRENCFSECLVQFTRGRGMMIESNVIHRNKYENSSLVLVHGYLRSLELDGRELTSADIKDSQIADLYPLFKRHWKMCRRICRFRDCVVESLFPFAPRSTFWRSAKLPKEERLIIIAIFPPHNQVMKVTSQPKLGLLDFIVYIACVLSFWFGLCPLQAFQVSKSKPVQDLMNKITAMRLVIMKGTAVKLKVNRCFFRIVVTCGFLYQSQHICDQYFRYPTITSVSMIDALPLTFPPKVTLEFWHPPKTGMVVRHVFRDYPDDSWISASALKKNFRGRHVEVSKTRRKSGFFNVTPFSKMGMYFVTLSLRNQSLAFSPQHLFTFREPMLKVDFRTNLVSRMHKWANKVKIYLTPHNEDMEGVQRSVAISCTSCRLYIFSVIYMTYTMKESKLLPPPYDTNCKDYPRETNFTSMSNCFSECLNAFTTKHGIVLEDSVLMRDKYENSSLVLVPWKLRELEGNKNIDDVLRGINNGSISEDLRRRIATVFPDYKRHWNRCKSICSQPDCHKQSIIPYAFLMAEVPTYGQVNRSDTSQFSNLILRVYPANDQVIVVESDKKYVFIDVVVYILSCLSFWFRFCPLESVKGMSSIWKYDEPKRIFTKTNFKRRLNRLLGKLLHHPFYPFLQLILYGLVFTGFVYEAGKVCTKYFKYETTTHVTMQTTTEGLIPRLVLPVSHENLVNDRIGFTLREVFTQINDETKLLEVQVQKDGRIVDDMDGNVIEFKRYLRLKHYTMYFSPRIPIKYSQDDLNRNPLMKISFQTNVMMKGRPAAVPSTIQSYHSDMEGHQKLPLSIPCIYGSTSCTIKLTFSTKIINLLPPPYESNCRDYRSIGKTSRDHCFSSCLNEFTKRHGMYLETNIADRDKLGNSSLILIPWELKTMTEDRTKLTSDHFLSDIKLRNHLRRSRKVSKEYFKKLADILPSYENHWKMCKSWCSQTDCYTESIVPEIIVYSSHGKYSRVSNVTIVIYPSKDPVITVTTTPKMKFLDFIVFILSCLSFWFGLCPLQVAEIKIKRENRVEDLTRKSNNPRKLNAIRDDMIIRKRRHSV